MKDEDGEEYEYQNSYQFQSDYKLTAEVYWYSNVKGIDSNYTSYFHDYTFSTGLGYQFINNATWLVEAEFGPGYRYQSPNTDELDSNDPIFPDDVDEAIFRTSLHAKWQVFEPMSLDMELTTVTGDSNSRIETDIGATYYLNDHVALKVTHSTDYLSRVPEGLSKTDKLFYVNLLFSTGK